MIEGAILRAVDFALEQVISEAFRNVFRTKIDDAREIIVEELRIGNIDVEAAARDDKVVAMMLAFAEAVRQNAAFTNLRLLAQVLANKAADQGARKDDFLMWADVLASLLPEEVVVLATIQRHGETAETQTSRPDHQHQIVRDGARSDLVGPESLCKTNEELQAIGGALLRTGFLIPVVEGGSGMSFYPSFRLKQLARMARLQEAADEAMRESA